MIFSVFQKMCFFSVFQVHPTVVSVLLSALVGCIVSRMRDFFKLKFWWNFSFGDISVVVKFSFDDNSVLVTFQFWCHFRFVDYYTLVTYQFW